jgi:hypothetical protein
VVSVTKRITQVQQPRGGYIKLKELVVTDLPDTDTLSGSENIHSSLVGMVVDYLTRYLNGAPIGEAFRISLLGASKVNKLELANELLFDIKSTDNSSIVSACKMVGFDVAFRAGVVGYRPVELINPDKETISNIRIMVNRGLNFFKLYGPIVKDGFNFEGGYTSTVDTGDGDFLTENTLWDFKVTKSAPTNKHTLQLLMYYLMGVRSIHPEFKQIENLGVFNPRLNKVYLLPINTISDEVINEVNATVIGYKYHDKQLKYVIDKYIIPGKKIDFNEIKTREELEDIEEGLKKFNKLSEEEAAELFHLIRNDNL